MNDSLPPVATVTGTNTVEGEELREVFSRSIARGHGGAQLVVTLNGKTIVDLAGGDITATTPVQVFSVSKLIVAIASAHAHMNGLIDLDAPISTYWDKFKRTSTEKITARMVLDHSSGISALSRMMTVDDLLRDEADREVAQQEPFWEPGSAHGYGAFTFGALMSGVFKNALKTSIQEYAYNEIIKPSGADFWFGAPKELLSSVASLSFDPPMLTEGVKEFLFSSKAIHDGAMMPILSDLKGFFTNENVIVASWPALSGVSTARSLAKVLNSTLGYDKSNGTLNKECFEGMIAERGYGMDRTLGHVTRYGSGVELPHAYFPILGGRSFGHQGAGGSVAVADPDSGLVLAYTSTHTESTVGASNSALTLLAAAKTILR